MTFKTGPGFVVVALAVAAAAAGAAVVVQGIELGAGNLRGLRLLAVLTGFVTCAAGVFLFQRGVRRRARADAIRGLFPKYHDRRSAGLGVSDSLLFDNLDSDHRSKKTSIGHRQIQAATRALLVSLEQEMRDEIARMRRPGRPACRRARLRAAGLSRFHSGPGGKRRRTGRRTSVGPAAILS